MKERLFKPLHWIMLILISLDFIDTSYRITYGYFSGQGVQPPVGDFNVQVSTLDFIVGVVFQLAIAYTIYMLYSMKRSGGYYLVGLNILFVIYGFVIGPFSCIFSRNQRCACGVERGSLRIIMPNLSRLRCSGFLVHFGGGRGGL